MAWICLGVNKNVQSVTFYGRLEKAEIFVTTKGGPCVAEGDHGWSGQTGFSPDHLWRDSTPGGRSAIQQNKAVVVEKQQTSGNVEHQQGWTKYIQEKSGGQYKVAH